MEIRHILELARKWFWMLILACLLGGAIGLLVSLIQPKIYDGSTSLLISSPNRNDNNAIVGDQQAAAAFTVFPTSTPVLQAIIQAIGDKSLTPTQLASMISVTNNVNTQIVTIDVKDGNPARAALIANDLAQQSIIQFRKGTVDTNVSESFLSDEINQIETQIKNTEQKLSAAQSSSTANSDPTGQAAQINNLNNQLANLRISYNALLTSYANLTGFQITQVQQAVISQKPISPKPTIAVAIGTLGGLLFMIGLILIIEQLDDGLRTPKKIMETTGLSTLIVVEHLASVSRSRDASPLIENSAACKTDDPVALLANQTSDVDDGTSNTIKVTRMPAVVNQSVVPFSSFENIRTGCTLLAEEFLTLGALLYAEYNSLDANSNKRRSLLITSPEDGDGKTLVASQVALGLARIGTEVILIDANLRKPRIHTIFGLSNTTGLSSLLQNNPPVVDDSRLATRARSALQATAEPKLSVLTSGPTVTSPSEILSLPAMLMVLNGLNQNAFIVIDSPSVLTSSETILMARKSDSILLVTNARHTTANKLNQSQEFLTRVNENILGVVLNEAGKQR